MDHAFRRIIEDEAAHWVLALDVPAEARCAPVLGAFRRLASRVLPDAGVGWTREGLAVWGRGDTAPAGAARLALRLAELVPETRAPVRHYTLPADQAVLAALVPGAAAPAGGPDPAADPGSETLLAMRRALAAVPAEAWVRRLPVVSVRHGAKARVVARRLAPDAAFAARALSGGRDDALPATDAALRVLEPMLLAFASRSLAGEGMEGRLLVPLVPEAALGGAYDALEAAAGRAGIARLVPEISLADAVAAPGPFAAARTRFAADGQRLMLACPGIETLPMLAALAAPGDLVCLPAEAAQAGESAEPGTIAALGPQRIVLRFCRDEADIAFGLARGIGLFEGAVVETLLAARAAAVA